MTREERKKNWALLVKPTHDCNYNCSYCYDAPFREKFKGYIMKEEIVHRVAKLAADYAENVTWIWHGGEPTLMGVDWYKTMQEVFYQNYTSNFSQCMQSNGSLLNEEWSKLFIDYEISIGVSFDAFYQSIREGERDSKVSITDEALKNFTAYHKNVGSITVINNENYKEQIEIYDYLKDEVRLNSIAFNHIYRSEGSVKNNLELTPVKYIKEFMKFYSHWLGDTGSNCVRERSAFEMTKQIMGNREVTCNHIDCRSHWVGVNPVGDLYPCDRYLPEKYYMGNIQNVRSVDEIYSSEGYQSYYNDVQERFDTHCRECGYFDYCKGGCNANHIVVSGGTGVDKSSCDIFRLKFNSLYEFWRDVDIYTSNINKFVQYDILTHPFFTIKEIKEIFTANGIKADWNYICEGKALLDCEEFKVFRIFNAFKGQYGDHTDYVIQGEGAEGIKRDSVYELGRFKEKRVRQLKNLLITNQTKLKEIGVI